jgi:putative ABC transport system permease protein
MKLALRELRRRPTRFATATVVLTLLVVLLLFLGGLLDGLYAGSTGALSAQTGKVIVTARNARNSLLRSRLEPAVIDQVRSAPDVTAVGGLNVALLGAQVPNTSELANVALLDYERAPNGVPSPPPDGEAYADRRLETAGAAVGDTIAVGTQKTPIRIRAFVDNTSYLLQSSLWVNDNTWRTTVAANRPDLQLAAGVSQALVVDGSGSAASLAKSIDQATNQVTSSLSKGDAILAIPGTREQRDTFLQIIYTTLGVGALVIGLFFSLLTLERTGLYGVLKALGSSSSAIFAGLVAQALVIATLAFVAGQALTALLSLGVPAKVPVMLTLNRSVFVFVGLVIAAIIGSAVSLRRIVRIDPASAIGGGS